MTDFEQQNPDDYILEEWSDWWYETSNNLPSYATPALICTVFAHLVEAYSFKSEHVAPYVNRMLINMAKEESRSTYAN